MPDYSRGYVYSSFFFFDISDDHCFPLVLLFFYIYVAPGFLTPEHVDIFLITNYTELISDFEKVFRHLKFFKKNFSLFEKKTICSHSQI
jgi:hypothetical protein